MSTINNLTQNHPIFLHANDIADICSPLHSLNISYFARVESIAEGSFSIISNNPKFMEVYFENEYYNVDIHTGDIGKFGRYVLWDDVPRGGKTLEMAYDAAQLDIKHTFTIIKKIPNGHVFYHFSSSFESGVINQVYLANLDLLNMFINYFEKTIRQSKKLSKSFNYKYQIDKNANGYTLLEPEALHMKIDKSKFISKIIQPSCPELLKNITKREYECLHYAIQGNGAKAIARILGISHRTIESHFEKLKSKFQVTSKSALIGEGIKLFMDQDYL